MDLLFSSPLDIAIQLDNESSRTLIDVLPEKPGGSRNQVPLYERDETVSGKVILRSREGRRIEHQGIQVLFIGAVIFDGDRSSAQEFISYSKELLPAGEIRTGPGLETVLNFEFRNAEKPYASYQGKCVQLRYFVRVIAKRRLSSNTKERDIWVHQFLPEAAPTPPVKIDVGIEDCLHIEFEYNKSKFHLEDVIVGRIYFLLVRLRLKFMEISLVRKESFGAPPNSRTETEQLVRFEVMDGAPVKGETIPIRLFLGGYDLTPTMRDAGCKFTSRNFLSLLLVDEQNRKYYKQTEIVLYRKDPKELPKAEPETKSKQPIAEREQPQRPGSAVQPESLKSDEPLDADEAAKSVEPETSAEKSG